MDKSLSPGLPRRLAAIVYDTFLVLPIVMLAVAMMTGIQIAITGDAGNNDFSASPPVWLIQLIAVLVLITFFGHFWRKQGQTLGMKAWRIRLRSLSGADISWSQSVLRCLAAIVSLAALGAGYWWCLFDRNGRYWHDYLSKTELELLPKSEITSSPSSETTQAG
jgi:uncharacterized RDD family membrane protein YckC